jgi:hypothetical protein
MSAKTFLKPTAVMAAFDYLIRNNRNLSMINRWLFGRCASIHPHPDKALARKLAY